MNSLILKIIIFLFTMKSFQTQNGPSLNKNGHDYFLRIRESLTHKNHKKSFSKFDNKMNDKKTNFGSKNLADENMTVKKTKKFIQVPLILNSEVEKLSNNNTVVTREIVSTQIESKNPFEFEFFNTKT